MKQVAVVSIAVMAVLASGAVLCAQEMITSKVATYTYKTINDKALKIHINFPPSWKDSDRRPVVMFFCEGGPNSRRVKQFSFQADYLAGRGLVAARAEYRAKRRDGVTVDKCVEDARSAVRWMRKNSKRLGIDPNKLVTSGGSGGGHLAACMMIAKSVEAEGDDLSISTIPQAMVLFNPVLSFENEQMIWQLDDNKHLAREISPTSHLDKSSPPALILFGTNDRFKVFGDDYWKKAEQIGVRADKYIAEGQGHGFFNRSPWRERTLIAADKFLVSLGYLKGEPTIKVPELYEEIKSLHRVVADGDIDQTRLLLSEGAEINAKDGNGQTVLHIAAVKNYKDIAELLIERGADVNATDRHDYTPLYYAIFNINKDMVNLLVNKGVDVNLTPEKDYTSLHYAVWMEDVDIVKLLVEKGAKFDVKAFDGWTAFRYAASQGSKDMVEFFISKGADTSGFHMAAFMGDLSRIKELFDQGTKIDHKDEAGWTALFWTACSGQIEMAEFFISKGADVNAKDERNNTPLHNATSAGHRRMAELLIAKGAEVNAKGQNNRTPLHFAAMGGHRNIVEVLIAHGAEVSTKDNSNRTALALAKGRRHTEIVQLLRKKGAKE